MTHFWKFSYDLCFLLVESEHVSENRSKIGLMLFEIWGLQFLLNKVFLACIVHLYSKLQVNPFINKDIRAEKLVCAFAHFRKRKWERRWNLFNSCPVMIHSEYYIEISIIICFLLREILQKNSLAQLTPFPPALMKKMKIYLFKVFASVQMHLYSKYE